MGKGGSEIGQDSKATWILQYICEQIQRPPNNSQRPTTQSLLPKKKEECPNRCRVSESSTHKENNQQQKTKTRCLLSAAGLTRTGSVSFRTFLLAHLFHFHPTVLEPDFDLSLCKVQNPGHLVAPVPGEVHVEEEFLLQL